MENKTTDKDSPQLENSLDYKPKPLPSEAFGLTSIHEHTLAFHTSCFMYLLHLPIISIEQTAMEENKII